MITSFVTDFARTYPERPPRARNTPKRCESAPRSAKNAPKSGANRTSASRRDLSSIGPMAKDTEKLIRQLSLIS